MSATASANLGLGTAVANYFDNSTATVPAPSVSFAATGVSGDSYLSFDWCYTGTQNAEVSLGDGTPDNLLIELTSTGVYNVNSGTTSSIATGLTAGTWYQLSAIIHMPGSTTGTPGTYDVTISQISTNSTIAAANRPFAQPTGGFTTLTLQEYGLSASAMGTNVSFDNFAVGQAAQASSGPANDVFTVPANVTAVAPPRPSSSWLFNDGSGTTAAAFTGGAAENATLFSRRSWTTAPVCRRRRSFPKHRQPRCIRFQPSREQRRHDFHVALRDGQPD